MVTLNLCHSEVFDWLTERRHITNHKPESGVAGEEQTWWTVISLSISLQESLFSVVKIPYFQKCSKTHDIITIQSACHAQTVVEVGILDPKHSSDEETTGSGDESRLLARIPSTKSREPDLLETKVMMIVIKWLAYGEPNLYMSSIFSRESISGKS